MIAKALIVVVLVTFIYSVQCEKLRFDNYTLYKTYPQNEAQISLLQELISDGRFDFWNEPVKMSEYVMVLSSPKNKKDFEEILRNNDVGFEITLSNIQENIDQEAVHTKYLSRIGQGMKWDQYYTLDEIYQWIDDLASSYPNIVTVIYGGVSHEDRQIKGLRISHGANKKIIFLEGGLHAREWITTATVNYITNEILTNSDPETQSAAKDYDWYIFPVTNPDGYVYTHTTNRMWRKNRRPTTGANFGVDLNRNWNNNWLAHGASSDESLDLYAGPGPFSEPETRTLSEYISSIGDNIDMYLSFHSFGHLLLLPFGNTTEPLDNYHDAINIGRRAMGALSVRYGTLYTTGNIAEAIYLATGGSVDWVKGHVQVPLVYCYELRDRGRYGFLLPPDQILPNSQETMDSVLELIHQAKRFGYLKASGNSLGVSVLMLVLIAVRNLF